MKVNIQKERTFYKKEREKVKNKKELNSQNKSLKREETSSRLTSLNSDIEKLYKKYAEIKKKRLLKEKSQQILVNRLKYLRNEVKRSVSKNEKDRPDKKFGDGNDEKNKKIFVKVNSKYKNNFNEKKGKESDKQSGKDIFNDNDSLSKISFNGNESEIIGSSYKSFNSKKLSNNTNKKSSSNLNSEKENNQNENNNSELNKNQKEIKNIEDLLKKYKYNIGNKNSNNNIYIIINNPSNNYCNEKSINNNLENDNKYDYDNCSPKENKNIKNENIFGKNNYKYKNENIIDLRDEGDNIILMNANGRKLQDIINSINNINYKINNDSNRKNESQKINKNNETKNTNNKINETDTDKEVKSNTIDNIKEEKELSIKKEYKEKNNIKKDENLIDEKIQRDEKNDGFIRPSFLNLYKNEDNSEMKQKIDINSYRDTNRFDNIFLQTSENILKNKKESNDNNEKRKLFAENETQKENDKNEKNTKTKDENYQHNTINSDNYLMNMESNVKEKTFLNKLNHLHLNQKKAEDTNNHSNSTDNIEYYKQYNSVNNTNNKNKINCVTSEQKYQDKENINQNNGMESKKNETINNKENKYCLINKKNKNNYLPIKFSKIDNRQINYSFSHKNFNNNKLHNLNSNKYNNYNTRWNINLEKIRKNNFRNDSYCTSIERKRKALGLEFKPNFGRELSIQTEKNTEKKKKILGRIKNHGIKNKNNFYKTNLFEDKLIKVRKKEEYKKLEKRFKFLKKSIENENDIHRMVKNKTSSNFNYNKTFLNNDNKSELRNIKINNEDLNFINSNDSISNKTSESIICSLVNKGIN